MAELKLRERLKIESFLQMKDGYVLSFSNRTFQEFIIESVGIDIYDQKYSDAGESKARRLRTFWLKESNYTVGKLLKDLIIYWNESIPDGHLFDTSVVNDMEFCDNISKKMMADVGVQEIDAIRGSDNDKDISLLAKAIRESIEKNEPELALDRLHTYVFKMIRNLCKEHSINIDKSESLNAVFGKYVKHLVDKKMIDSLMSEKILKYSISILDAFNDVRNNKTFAHPNSLLNYDESHLIVNNVTKSVNFIQKIEQRNKPKPEAKAKLSDADLTMFSDFGDDLPF
jgi:hypothetical protein